MATIISDGRRTILEVPSSKVLKDRLSQVLYEAAQLQVVLQLASELESVEPYKPARDNSNGGKR